MAWKALWAPAGMWLTPMRPSFTALPGLLASTPMVAGAGGVGVAGGVVPWVWFTSNVDAPLAPSKVKPVRPAVL